MKEKVVDPIGKEFSDSSLQSEYFMLEVPLMKSILLKSSTAAITTRMKKRNFGGSLVHEASATSWFGEA